MNQAGSMGVAAGGRAVIAVNVTQTPDGRIDSPQGTLVLDGATVTGGFLSGPLEARNGAIVKDLVFGFPGGTGATTLTGGSTLGLQGTVTNKQTLTIGSNGVGATLNNFGVLDDISGTLNVNPGSTLANAPSGVIFFGNNTIAGNFRNDGAAATGNTPLVVTQTGTLSGTGALSGDVLMAGIMSPGNALPGTFQIAGSYTQTATGTFLAQLAGPTQFANLLVFGDVFLGGTLNVALFGGFDPQQDCPSLPGVCDTFDIIQASFGTISGFFANLIFPNDGLDWQAVVLNDTDVRVIVSNKTIPAPEPGTWSLPAVGCIGIACRGWRNLRRIH